MRILVTGAKGFVGSALCTALRKRNWDVNEATRGEIINSHDFRVGSIDGHTDWSAAVQRCDTVVHLAARVHVMNDPEKDPLYLFRKVNVEGTINLARQAVKAGVRRLIFVSSIKVNGEQTQPGTPFKADDTPNPIDPYGISKHEAELGLRQIALTTGIEVVCVRPVLVYGPGVKANFLSMMSWLYRGIPMPFGAINNRRSLVALDNLVDLLITCIDHPAAANQCFLVSDNEDLSTSELLCRMAMALGKPARLLPVPSQLLGMIGMLASKDAIAQRLLGTLQVDINKTRSLLGWVPPVNVDEGLKRVAEYFLETKKR